MYRKLLSVYMVFALSGLFIPAGVAWSDESSSPVVVQKVVQNQASPLDDQDIAHYSQLQADANDNGQLATPGGAEAGTGTIVLATIGALVLIGLAVAIAAS